MCKTLQERLADTAKRTDNFQFFLDRLMVIIGIVSVLTVIIGSHVDESQFTRMYNPSLNWVYIASAVIGICYVSLLFTKLVFLYKSWRIRKTILETKRREWYRQVHPTLPAEQGVFINQDALNDLEN